MVAGAFATAALTVVFAGTSAKADHAIKNLPAVKPVMACGSLVGINLSGISGAIGGTITISSATIVPAGSNNPAEYCAVKGNIGPGTNTIVMRLPTQGWTQKGVSGLMVLSPVALDLALVQFDPTDTVTSNQ